MKSFRISNLVAAGLAAAVLSACGGRSAAVQSAPPPRPSPTQATPAGIALARADSARYPYTAADIHFMSAMIGHHAQAIVMAGWAPSHSASPAIQRLAARIINAQQDEIVTMQRWLAERRQPVPEANPAGMKMTMNGTQHVMLMPGMLTEAQMKQLDGTSGPEFDRQFLTFMIQHHKGAVEMVSQLFNTDGAGQDGLVFKFASDVNVDQATEIHRMERMLDALGPEKRSQ